MRFVAFLVLAASVPAVADEKRPLVLIPSDPAEEARARSERAASRVLLGCGIANLVFAGIAAGIAAPDLAGNDDFPIVGMVGLASAVISGSVALVLLIASAANWYNGNSIGEFTPF